MKEFIHQMIAPILAVLGGISIASGFSKGFIENGFTLSHPFLMTFTGAVLITCAVLYALKLFKNK